MIKNGKDLFINLLKSLVIQDHTSLKYEKIHDLNTYCITYYSFEGKCFLNHCLQKDIWNKMIVLKVNLQSSIDLEYFLVATLINHHSCHTKK